MWTHPAVTSAPRGGGGGLSGCFKEPVWDVSLEFLHAEWLSGFEEAAPVMNWRIVSFKGEEEEEEEASGWDIT